MDSNECMHAYFAFYAFKESKLSNLNLNTKVYLYNAHFSKTDF